MVQELHFCINIRIYHFAYHHAFACLVRLVYVFIHAVLSQLTL